MGHSSRCGGVIVVPPLRQNLLYLVVWIVYLILLGWWRWQMEVPSDLFSERQMEFLLEGMTLALQIVDGDVLWAHMPEHVTLAVTVREEVI